MVETAIAVAAWIGELGIVLERFVKLWAAVAGNSWAVRIAKGRRE